jgi:hypothetical protein
MFQDQFLCFLSHKAFFEFFGWWFLTGAPPLPLPRSHFHCLETDFIISTGERGYYGPLVVEARDLAEHPHCTEQTPTMSDYPT